MPDPLSRRDYPRESHDPSPTKPNQAQLTTSLGHPIHPTTSTSTHERDTMDGSKILDVDAVLAAWRDPDYVRRLALDAQQRDMVEVDNPMRPELRPRRGTESTTETTDQSRPVVGLVARVQDESAETRLIDRRCRCSRPAAELHRTCLWHDSVSALYAKDLLAEVHRLDADLEAARAADAATIGVLSAAVAKVAALHVDDGDGWCKACQTLGYPCPTVLALGAGR